MGRFQSDRSRLRQNRRTKRSVDSLPRSVYWNSYRPALRAFAAA